MKYNKLKEEITEEFDKYISDAEGGFDNLRAIFQNDGLSEKGKFELIRGFYGDYEVNINKEEDKFIKEIYSILLDCPTDKLTDESYNEPRWSFINEELEQLYNKKRLIIWNDDVIDERYIQKLAETEKDHLCKIIDEIISVLSFYSKTSENFLDKIKVIIIPSEEREYEGFEGSFSPDCRSLILSDGHRVHKWDILTIESKATRLLYLKESSEKTEVLCYNRTNDLIAALNSIEENRTLKIWDIANYEFRSEIQGVAKDIMVLFGPDTSTLFTFNDDNNLRLWNINDGILLTTLSGHNSKICALTYSTDGKTLASGSEDGIIKIWNINTAQIINTLNGHSQKIERLEFSPDGRLLASLSIEYLEQNYKLNLWDVASAKLIKAIDLGNIEYLTNNIFCLTNNLLATCGERKVDIWNTTNGEHIKKIPVDKGDMCNVFFIQRNNILACSNNDITTFFDTNNWQPVGTVGASGTIIDCGGDEQIYLYHKYMYNKTQIIQIDLNFAHK